jgi:hypothetical protein
LRASAADTIHQSQNAIECRDTQVNSDVMELS